MANEAKTEQDIHDNRMKVMDHCIGVLKDDIERITLCAIGFQPEEKKKLFVGELIVEAQEALEQYIDKINHI